MFEVYWEGVLWENGGVAEEEVEGVCAEGVCLITHDNQPGGHDTDCVEALVSYNQ